MTTPSTDIDMSGTLITTEWGNPPQLQPAGVDNYQGYGASGQGVEKVYKYLYDPTDNVAPLDESEGGLDLQEQEWVGEVEFIEQADPEFIEGGDITGDVIFENPLDTLNKNAAGVGENDVDFDREVDPAVENPVADGVEEETTEEAETPSETPQQGSEATEAAEAPVVAPEVSEAPVADDELHPF